jgi:hypothetical protein
MKEREKVKQMERQKEKNEKNTSMQKDSEPERYKGKNI